MKNLKLNSRVKRVLLAIALTPAALAFAPGASAEIPASLQLAERQAARQAARHETGATVAAPREATPAPISTLVEAAEAGNGPAQRQLGALYDRGAPGVKRDFAQSIRWYQKARERGEEIPTPPTYRYLQ